VIDRKYYDVNREYGESELRYNIIKVCMMAGGWLAVWV